MVAKKKPDEIENNDKKEKIAFVKWCALGVLLVIAVCFGGDDVMMHVRYISFKTGRGRSRKFDLMVMASYERDRWASVRDED